MTRGKMLPHTAVNTKTLRLHGCGLALVARLHLLAYLIQATSHSLWNQNLGVADGNETKDSEDDKRHRAGQPLH